MQASDFASLRAQVTTAAESQERHLSILHEKGVHKYITLRQSLQSPTTYLQL